MSPERPTRPLRSRLIIGGAVVIVAAAAGAGGVLAIDGLNGDSPPSTSARATAAPTTTSGTTTPAALTATSTDFSAIYAARANGVVAILAGSGTGATPNGPRDLPGEEPSASRGSGVVVDPEGYILTNEHVVSGATTVRVSFASGTSLDATVVGTDPSTDLALLKVKAPSGSLTTIPLGDSSTLEVGQPVLAIGNPFGYAGSATSGIVSGLGRSIRSPNGFSVPDAIQTDAAVNHGNSGGALLNAEGELIGVPAQIADSGVDANVGVAFAIPSNTAARVIDDLRANGTVDHAWLGVSTASVDDTLRGLDGVGAESGALITGLAQGGPAAGAGLHFGDRLVSSIAGPVCTGGDIVTAVDGMAVKGADDLQLAIDAKSPGATVTLTVIDAAGKQRSVKVTLKERPDTAPQTAVGCGG